MKIITKKPWFGPRYLGWGYRPITWEGWVSTLVLIAVLLILGAKFRDDPNLAYYVFAIVAIFTLFCYLTSGKPGMIPFGKKR